MTADEWWTTEQVAEYLNVSPRTIEDWRYGYILTGPLGVRFGKNVRYHAGRVRALVRRLEVEQQQAAKARAAGGGAAS